MNTILTALNGKKTYIVAAATILYCLIGLSLHYMAIPMAISIIGTTGSIATLRLGVAKVQSVLEVILEILKLIGKSTPGSEVPTPPVPPVVAPVTPAATEVIPPAIGGVAQ